MGFKCFLVKHRACTHRWGCLLNILEVSIGVIFSIYYRLLLELSAQYTEGYYQGCLLNVQEVSYHQSCLLNVQEVSYHQSCLLNILEVSYYQSCLLSILDVSYYQSCLLNILEVSTRVVYSIYQRLVLGLSAQYTRGQYQGCLLNILDVSTELSAQYTRGQYQGCLLNIPYLLIILYYNADNDKLLFQKFIRCFGLGYSLSAALRLPAALRMLLAGKNPLVPLLLAKDNLSCGSFVAALSSLHQVCLLVDVIIVINY